MGFSKAIIAIKGNQSKKIKKINEILNLMDDEAVFEQFSATIKFENGWTILSDDEMVVVTEDDLLAELSDEFEKEVYAFIVQSTSATYGFSNFKDGEMRFFLLQDGEIVADLGEKLAAEKELNFNENTSAIDIIKLAAKIGIAITE